MPAPRAPGPIAGRPHEPHAPVEDPLIYGERSERSVANNTREDGRAFLAEAARLPVRTRVEAFALADANEALAAMKTCAVRGAAVLAVR